MRWRLFATLAEVAGDTEVRAPPAGNGDGAVTVQDALEGLLEAHPDLAAEVLDGDGQLVDHVRLLVDGSDPRTSDEGMATTIDDDAELALFPPVSGG